MPDNYAWIDKLSPYEAQAALGGIKDQFRSGMTAREATDSFTYERTAMIAALAIANEIPAIYAFPRFVHDGGLIAYGVDLADQIRNAGGYVAQILKGDNSG